MSSHLYFFLFFLSTVITVSPDVVWVPRILSVSISYPQAFKAKRTEDVGEPIIKKQRDRWCLVPSSYPLCTVSVGGVCARTEPYRKTGKNRVYMDLLWPLKEKEVTGQSLLDYYWFLVTACSSRYTDMKRKETDFHLKTATKWRE